MKLSLDLAWILYPMVAFAAYWPSLNGQPIFDDQDVLPKVQKGKWDWGQIWYSRPWTGISFGLQAMWPNTIRGLHVFNVLAHVGCGLIVQSIARRIGLDGPLDTFAGLLFMVHPFAVNTVGYISARGALISCFFGLSAVLALLCGHPVFAIGLWMLAMGGKEDAAGFGPLLVVLLFWKGAFLASGLIVALGVLGLVRYRKRLRDFVQGSGDAMMRQIGLPVSLSQPGHALTVLVETLNRLPFWFGGLGQSPYHGSGIGVPRVFRFLQAWFIALAFGFALTLWPVPVLLILLGPWLVYLACPVPDQLMEYRNYSMTAGFALLITVFFASAPALAWIFLIVNFGTLTAWSAMHWKTPIAFWLAASFSTSGDPSRAYGELGAYYKLKDDKHSARIYLEEAIRLNPGFAPALNNLAWVSADEGKTDEAIQLLESCTSKCPEYALGWQDLGLMYERQQRWDDAARVYQSALDLESGMDLPVNRLGIVAFHQRRWQDAIILFYRALLRRPDHFEYVYNRAVAMKHAGDPQAGAEFDRLPKPCPVTPNMIPVEFAR